MHTLRVCIDMPTGKTTFCLANATGDYDNITPAEAFAAVQQECNVELAFGTSPPDDWPQDKPWTAGEVWEMDSTDSSGFVGRLRKTA